MKDSEGQLITAQEEREEAGAALPQELSQSLCDFEEGMTQNLWHGAQPGSSLSSFALNLHLTFGVKINFSCRDFRDVPV